MMACNCGGRRAGVKYEVTFHGGTKQTYATLSEAQAAGNQTGETFTVKAVPA